ncbi:hypothetical protein [Amycolatopsis eburnea]|uniref:Uncharacterized protein n=1 Tax=Amycolatopsis eburnea TaxID=2267691 RepID=A0A3R9FES6_9PSEU|nr:hypothetical protein [Amycolatopsis eburnea]RSD26375.1 hypothetical protein EIY87_00490 [Amycolatopsis eburnea]
MPEAPDTPFELPVMTPGPAQGAPGCADPRPPAEHVDEPHVLTEDVEPAPELDDSLLIGASIFEGATSVNRHVNISLPRDADDLAIAEQLLLSTLAVATAYRPGVAHALTALLAPSSLESLR